MSIAFPRSLPQTTEVGETASILAVFRGNKYQERRSELSKVGSGLISASAAQRSQEVQKPRSQAEPLCPVPLCSAPDRTLLEVQASNGDQNQKDGSVLRTLPSSGPMAPL